MIEDFIRKPLSDWDGGDLNLLLGQAQEDDRSEFKSEMYGASDEPVREMLRDIASLANHQGGYLLIGIEESADGAATALSPVQSATPTTHDERIRASCRSNIAPRINGLEVRTLQVAGGEVVVVHVPYSYRRPHMVTFKGLNQFWKRHGREKNPMTIDEIEYAFARRLDGTAQVRSFIGERVGIASRLSQDPRLYLYATPVSYPDELVDIRDEQLRLMMCTGAAVESTYVGVRNQMSQPVPTLEGLMSVDPTFGQGRYLAVHRSGHIEFFTTQDWYDANDTEATKLYSANLAAAIVDFASLVSKMYQHLEVSVPVLYGAAIHSSRHLWLQHGGNQIARWMGGPLIVESMYEPNPQESQAMSANLSDRVWNAFGREACWHITESGGFVDKSG